MSRILSLQTADSASLARYGTIIDVRSPGEFASTMCRARSTCRC